MLLAAIMGGVGTAWAEEEVTIASFSHASNTGWTITNAEYATAGNGYYKLISSEASIVTPSITWSNYTDITITISARKYNGPDTTQGKISVSQGETELTSYSPSGTSIAASTALSISPVDGTITISCPGASSSKGCGVQSIVIKGKEKASESPLASITLSGEYPTTFVEGAEFSHEGMTVTATYEDNSTKDVTSKAKFSGYEMATSGSQVVTVSYTEGGVTKTATYNITVNAIPSHNVVWSVNGTTTTESYKEGAAIIFPSNLDDVEDKSFVGWVTEEITGTTDEAPTFVTSATMGTEALTFFAVFADKTPGTQTTVTDVLTNAKIGVTGTNSYSDWSGKSFTSNAIYSGNSAQSSVGSIQMRSNNSNSGIISTTSGGTLKSVTVTWSDGNTSGRSLDVYGKNTAYTAATDLYDSGKQGTKLGSITYSTSKSLTISGDYAYIGLRSNNGALYLTDISIEWTTGTPDSYSAYCTIVATDTRAEAGISFAEATVTKEILDSYTGQTLTNPNNVSPITWTSSNEAVATVDEDGTVTILAVGETTITATFAGDDSYKKATASYTLTVQDSRTAPGFSFSEATAEASIGEDFTAPTFNNPNNVAVTFESTDENVATVDDSGNVTIHTAGTTTIKATSEATTTYSAGEASYTLTVVDPNQPGTENNPYTVAQARAAIDAGTGVTNVYATGIVSEIVTAYSSQYGNITYNISSDGTTKADQLQAYRGKSYNGDSFTSEEDIKVGDVVVIYGSLTKYGSTYEFSANNQLVSLERPVVTTPSISVSNNSIEATAEETDGTITVTYNNISEIAAEVYFCDAEGEEISYDWITAEINEETNNVDYLIEANEGDARTAYLKVYALDDEANDVYSELITISQAKFVVTTSYTLATAIVPGKHYVFASGTDGSVYAMGAMKSTNREAKSVTATNGKINLTGEEGAYEFMISGPDANGNYVIYDESTQSTGYLYAAGGTGNNHLKVQTAKDKNAEWSITINSQSGVATIKAKMDEGTSDRNWMRFNSSSKIFSCYSSNQSDIYLFAKDGEMANTETANITAAKYATYCSDNALEFTGSGLTAYMANVSGNTVTFTEVTCVPANTGVLLKGEAGEKSINVVAASKTSITSNAFVGVTEETPNVAAGIFVLMNGDKGVGFYKTTQTFTVGANTAYLPALASGSDDARSFIALDEATAIESIAAEKMMNNGAVYNLQGQRVAKAQKGLYIVDGKKVLVK